MKVDENIFKKRHSSETYQETRNKAGFTNARVADQQQFQCSNSGRDMRNSYGKTTPELSEEITMKNPYSWVSFLIRFQRMYKRSCSRSKYKLDRRQKDRTLCCRYNH